MLMRPQNSSNLLLCCENKVMRHFCLQKLESGATESAVSRTNFGVNVWCMMTVTCFRFTPILLILCQVRQHVLSRQVHLTCWESHCSSLMTNEQQGVGGCVVELYSLIFLSDLQGLKQVK